MQSRTRNITLAAILLAMVIVLGFIPPVPLGFLPVPIVFQNLGILIIAVLLEPLWALLTVGAFLMLVAVGLPVLTGFRGGIGMFVGATAGYLVGYLVGAGILSWWTHSARNNNNGWRLLMKIAVVAVVVIDGCGIIGTSVVTGITLTKSLWLSLVFIPGDILKSVLAAVISRPLQRRLTRR